MGNNGYLKFILTALVLAIVFFGYMLVTAVDRVRESNLRLLAKLDELPGRISVTAPAAVPAQAAAIRREPFANAEFFDPSAQTGGRMIPPEVLCALADFYGVSVDYLLRRTDIPETAEQLIRRRKRK